ncbi:MAG: hypothetical protein RML36_15255 [Anaerolineae bacterium]|nr:hypothetical protein [Anaerolineae bacterium]
MPPVMMPRLAPRPQVAWFAGSKGKGASLLYVTPRPASEGGPDAFPVITRVDDPKMAVGYAALAQAGALFKFSDDFYASIFARPAANSLELSQRLNTVANHLREVSQKLDATQQRLAQRTIRLLEVAELVTRGIPIRGPQAKQLAVTLSSMNYPVLTRDEVQALLAAQAQQKDIANPVTLTKKELNSIQDLSVVRAQSGSSLIGGASSTAIDYILAGVTGKKYQEMAGFARTALAEYQRNRQHARARQQLLARRRAEQVKQTDKPSEVETPAPTGKADATTSGEPTVASEAEGAPPEAPTGQEPWYQRITRQWWFGPALFGAGLGAQYLLSQAWNDEDEETRKIRMAITEGIGHALPYPYYIHNVPSGYLPGAPYDPMLMVRALQLQFGNEQLQPGLQQQR